MKLLRDFVACIAGDWLSAISCIAAMIFLFFSCWFQNVIEGRAFSLAAIAFLLIGLAKAWAMQYRRAEKACAENMKEPRPRISIEQYSETRDEREHDQDYLIETLQISNKGELPAKGITVRPVQVFGRTARLFASIANLDPGETKEIRILNLRRTMERAAEKAILSKGHALAVRIPLIVEYQDPEKARWITEHVVLFGAGGVDIDVVRWSEPPEWTAFSPPRGKV
jgi:hypothetical protein